MKALLLLLVFSGLGMASALRPLAEHAARRRLSGAQENLLSNTAFVRDSLRQASAAEARSRIRTAVDAGGSMETTTAASTRAATPLLLRLRLRALRQDASMNTDAMRAVRRQERSADATAMIRRAVGGGDTDMPAPVVAERVAGSTPQSRLLP